MIIDWMPTDFAAVYRIELDKDLNFIKLIKMFDCPPEMFNSQEIPVQQKYIDYCKEIWPKCWHRVEMLKKMGKISTKPPVPAFIQKLQQKQKEAEGKTEPPKQEAPAQKPTVTTISPPPPSLPS